MWRIILLTFTFPIYTLAAPITPKFTTGVMESNSVTKQIINETIVTSNYRSGYTINISGTNIRPISGQKITPEATYANNQTVDGVSFSWITPNLNDKIQWEIVNEGESFAILESILSPGLDATSIVQRTIETEINTNTISTFGQ